MNNNRIWFCSDRHLTVSVPKAVIDKDESNWINYQKEIFQQVKELVGEELLIDAGDILDTGLPYKSQLIVNTVVDNSPENTWFIHGNHCLHSFGAQVDLSLIHI